MQVLKGGLFDILRVGPKGLHYEMAISTAEAIGLLRF